MISVLINCPGGWSHGLDSPERGESRWAQNLVKLLAKHGGYKLFACSGGPPTWGRGEVVEGVTLLSEPEANKGAYDIYIDSSWYEGKGAVGTARASIHAYWTPEPWMFKPLPPGHHIVYVYRQLREKYLSEENANRAATHYLPATFGPALASPDPSARRVLSFSRYVDGGARFSRLMSAVQSLRRELAIPFVWLDQEAYPRASHPDDRSLTHPVNEPWGIPYCELLTHLKGAGLNASFGGGGSIADCAVYGIPSLICDDNFSMLPSLIDIARSHDLLLSSRFEAGEIEQAMRRLYESPALYLDYTRDMQDVYRDHTDANALRLFNELVEKVL